MRTARTCRVIYYNNRTFIRVSKNCMSLRRTTPCHKASSTASIKLCVHSICGCVCVIPSPPRRWVHGVGYNISYVRRDSLNERSYALSFSCWSTNQSLWTKQVDRNNTFGIWVRQHAELAFFWVVFAQCPFIFSSTTSPLKLSFIHCICSSHRFVKNHINRIRNSRTSVGCDRLVWIFDRNTKINLLHIVAIYIPTCIHAYSCSLSSLRGLHWLANRGSRRGNCSPSLFTLWSLGRTARIMRKVNYENGLTHPLTHYCCATSRLDLAQLWGVKLETELIPQQPSTQPNAMQLIKGQYSVLRLAPNAGLLIMHRYRQPEHICIELKDTEFVAINPTGWRHIRLARG